MGTKKGERSRGICEKPMWSHEYGKIELHERHQPLVYLSSLATNPQLETISRRRGECPYQNPFPKERTCEEACCHRDIVTPSLKTPAPHALINPQSVFSQSSDLLFNDVTCKRRPTCLSLEDFVSRDLETTPSTGPALLAPLLDSSSTASMLELRCESLVANISCARGILQVRVLCIKAVKKAKRGRGRSVAEEARVIDIDISVHHAESGFHGRRAFGELVKVEEVVEDDGLLIELRVVLNKVR
jgi:hypothetical protein